MLKLFAEIIAAILNWQNKEKDAIVNYINMLKLCVEVTAAVLV